SMHDYGWPTTS
nr:immunoglobulin light chain junction region [Macaca mulatta]